MTSARASGLRIGVDSSGLRLGVDSSGLRLGVDSSGLRLGALTALLAARRSGREFGAEQLQDGELVGLAWAAQGETGDGHRTTPSAGGYHPVAVTAVAARVADTATGLWRWQPERGSLQAVAAGSYSTALAATTLDARDWIDAAAAVLLLSADLQAAAATFATQPPAWQRGARYVWLEAGAAMQNVALRAAETGLSAVVVGGFDDDMLRSVHPFLLPEDHDPLVLIAVGHHP